MNERWHALIRLLAVQGSWNYERMLGVGMGYAAEPLLDDLKSLDVSRHPEAVVRSAEFFNCNPNLAGLALGATVRAEYEGADGSQIARLRTALCSPLGALGDRFFWAGVVPALVGAAVTGVVVGFRWRAVVAFVVVYNMIRLATGVWALRTGMAAGLEVGRAIADSWLPRAAARIGPVAGFFIALAIPPAVGWYLRDFPAFSIVGVVAVGAVGVLLSRWYSAVFTAVRFALIVAGLAVALQWALA